MIFYVLLSGCLPITLINSLEGFSQCILSKHLVSEYLAINRQRKSEERKALKVKKHSEFLKLKTGVSKVHFVPEKLSTAFYERVLYDAMRLSHRFSQNTRNEGLGDIIVVRRKNN